MRGRFILGLDGSAEQTRQAAADILGATSGEDYHTLTIPEMP
jgi:hypothetical protein